MDRVEAHRTAPHPVECCDDPACESGLKNNYFEGKRLTPDSFRVEQRYHVERRRLLNRAIHGWGVVNGYRVTRVADEFRRDGAAGRLRIRPGLALDACGRELVQTEIVDRAVDQMIMLDEHGARIEPSKNGRAVRRHPKHGPKHGGRVCWLLSVHYAEQPLGPLTINDPCNCKRHEWDHVCETVRYSLRPIDCDDCCHDFPCELECGCGTGPCCDEHDRKPADTYDPRRPQQTAERGHDTERHETHPQPEPCEPFTRGGCQCLCEHLTGLQLEAECRLCEIDEPCGRVRVDLRHGVPLACVQLVQDECDRWVFGSEIEACGPRRLVKRNDLLFDLIRGCDLTRISAIGWARWHRSRRLVEWDDFVASFGTETPPESGSNVTRDYWVEFSRPVRADTVRADCFAMTIMIAEDKEGWWDPHRVPILEVITEGGTDVPAGHITRATLVVDAGWVKAALIDKKSIFNFDKSWVELEVFGAYIVDCNGQTVDADVRGLCAVPSGNGTPGGTLRSSFEVEARDPRVRARSHDTSVRGQGA